VSKIGEFLLRSLNNHIPEGNRSLLQAKQNPATYQKFFAVRSKSSFAMFGDLDLTGLDVLDVGCGLGANLIHLYELGAKTITGLDISVTQATCTKNLLNNDGSDVARRTRFVGADAACMPFADESFDALVAADTFEHIDALEEALVECARVLKPSGRLYAYFPPFYAPWGAHMVNWVRLPWCQLFFAEETILNVAREMEKVGKSINSKLPPETRLDLGSGDRIPFVNHLTLSRFHRAVRNIPTWEVAQAKFLPPNWRTNSWSLKFLQPINHIPLLQEIFTAKAVFVIQKNPIY
jgi:SAM-dependent methyltransferase